MSSESRREFLKRSVLAAGASSLGPLLTGACRAQPGSTRSPRPLAVSTWRHGLAANEAAWALLESGGPALDAVEAGVRISEADPAVTSVGLGGAPDAEGKVTLDACIMNQAGDCGSVAFLEQILHPVSVARLVMEKTPHVMLVGSGALDFALAQGFEKTNLLTPEAAAKWREWKREAASSPPADEAHHDTIGMLAIDAGGALSGACTTSGLGFKLRGRVGDSPIIGAGLYVDGDVGAACATGHGELVMKTLGSFLIVELMRQGSNPEQACRAALQRLIDKGLATPGDQVGYLALNKAGEIGAASLHSGFQFAVRDASGGTLHPAPALR